MKSTIGKFIYRLFIADVIVVVATWGTLLGTNGVRDGTPVTPLAKVLYEPSVVSAFILIGFFVLIFLFGLFGTIRHTNRALDRAVVPVPSPAEIYVRIQNETGKEPSIADVAAIHQMLQSEQRQAAGEAAVGAGALYLAWKLSHR